MDEDFKSESGLDLDLAVDKGLTEAELVGLDAKLGLESEITFKSLFRPHIEDA